jgi:hypothetical protein
MRSGRKNLGNQGVLIYLPNAYSYLPYGSYRARRVSRGWLKAEVFGLTRGRALEEGCQSTKGLWPRYKVLDHSMATLQGSRPLYGHATRFSTTLWPRYKVLDHSMATLQYSRPLYGHTTIFSTTLWPHYKVLDPACKPLRCSGPACKGCRGSRESRDAAPTLGGSEYSSVWLCAYGSLRGRPPGLLSHIKRGREAVLYSWNSATISSLIYGSNRYLSYKETISHIKRGREALENLATPPRRCWRQF